MRQPLRLALASAAAFVLTAPSAGAFPSFGRGAAGFDASPARLWALPSYADTAPAQVTDPWVKIEAWTARGLPPAVEPLEEALGDDAEALTQEELGEPAPHQAITLVDVGGGMHVLRVPLTAFALPDDRPCELALEAMPSLRLFDDDLWVGAPWPKIEHNGHHEKDGRWVEYDQIARRWDRPESYGAYRYPVPTAWVASGYDLDKPDEEQRRGKLLSAVGHGGIDLAEKKGTPIRMVALEHQIGDAEVLYVGHLFGESVVTRHTIREGGKKRDYVLIFGHLEKAGEEVWRGRRLRAGELVGYVGDTDSPEFVHLHLEARRMRDGVDAWKVPGYGIRDVSVVCDARNVLPLRVPYHRRPKCDVSLLGQPQPHRKAWFRPMQLELGQPDDDHPPLEDPATLP